MAGCTRLSVLDRELFSELLFTELISELFPELVFSELMFSELISDLYCFTHSGSAGRLVWLHFSFFLTRVSESMESWLWIMLVLPSFVLGPT